MHNNQSMWFLLLKSSVSVVKLCTPDAIHMLCVQIHVSKSWYVHGESIQPSLTENFFDCLKQCIGRSTVFLSLVTSHDWLNLTCTK